jgi:ABC-2 type transport system ATP-binding protein
VPFSEVSAHHATLEQAYLELTRDAAEYRAADAGGAPPGPAGHGGTPTSGQEAAR